MNLFFEYMENIHTKYSTSRKLITGDFNLPGINWENIGLSTCWRTYYTDFCNFLTDNHLEQLVHKSTHIAGNILDLICTDLSYKVQSTNVITPGISDHFMIETVLTGKVEQKKKPSIPPPSSYFTKSNSTDSQLV